MRTNFLLLISCFLLSLQFSSCETDLDVNADWKEISIVYGLLNVDDSIQYIKINKAFLNENTSAIEVAAIEDSLYQSDSLTVILQELNKRGEIIRGINLQKTYVENKESGIFPYPGQYLYRTPPGVTINADNTYTLYIRNTVTGYETSANTPVVNPIKPIYPSNVQTQIQFWRYSDIRFSWVAGLDAKFYNVDIYFYYDEYPKTNPSALEEKVMIWRLGTYMLSNPTITEEMTLKVNGESFYRTVGSSLNVDPEIFRKAKGIEMRFASGATEAYYYLTLNAPSLGIVQRKPEYTNMSNGFGIFSSRNFMTVPATLADQSIDSLILGSYTRNLNFTR